MVDEHLFRSMVEGHSKTPLEFMYLQSILKRPEGELVRGVFDAQKENPVNGDFIKLIQAHFDILGATFSETETTSTCKEAIKI